MSEVLLANIFFMITAMAVVVFTVLVCVLVYHLIKIVRTIRRIVDRVEAGSEVLADDIEHIRDSLNAAELVKFMMRFVPGAQARTRRRKAKSE